MRDFTLSGGTPDPTDERKRPVVMAGGTAWRLGETSNSTMKTYRECEQFVSDKLVQLEKRLEDLESVDRLAERAGYLKALAVDLMYENELLRDKSNIRETTRPKS